MTKDQVLSKLLEAMSKISEMSEWDCRPEVLMFHGTPENLIVVADYTRDLGPSAPVFVDTIQDGELTSYRASVGMRHHEAVTKFMRLVSEYESRNT